MVDAIKIDGAFAETYNIGLSVIEPVHYGFGDSYNIGLVHHTFGGDNPPFKLKLSEQLSYEDPEADEKSGDVLTARARKFKGYGGRHISFSALLSGPVWLDQPNDPDNLELSHLTPESTIWVLKQMASKHSVQRPDEVGAPIYPQNMVTRGRGGFKTVVVPRHPVTEYPAASRVPLLVFTYGAMHISPCVITSLRINYEGWRPTMGLSEAEVTIELQEILTKVSNWIPNTAIMGPVKSISKGGRSKAFAPSHEEYTREKGGFDRKSGAKEKAAESQTSVGRTAARAKISAKAVSNRQWIGFRRWLMDM